MDMLYDSMSILEALYDLDLSRETLMEEIIVMEHNYKKTGNVEMLTEGVGDMITLIVDSIKKFLQKMKDFVVRKFMIINSYRMEYDRLIEKYGKFLADISFDPFLIEGYRFTTLSVPRPNTSMVIQIVDEFNSTIAKFSSLTTEDIREMNNKSCSDLAFQRLRADVLGASNRIPQEDFKGACFKFYRNNQEYTEQIEITKDIVGSILKNSSALIAEKKIMKSDKDSVLTILSNMERFFSVKVSSLYDDIKKTYTVRNLSKSGMGESEAQIMGEKEMGKLTMYLSSRYQQVVELANIISIVFVERMSAINDQTNQELQILRQVLKEKNGAMEGVDAMMEAANSYPPTPNRSWAPIWDGVPMGGEVV